ncbi:energy transducer TonB [Variovorax sp. J22G73]|jgi:protein TonB|uniref:energy transducer TonB n=1 Tax=unclassified Variovorax TaxID=663243 RepID=UPI000D5C5134|nr:MULTISPECIES: energy transducer TonB [unclassified Variovorax]MDM0009115.1 energy transducer TonB [Variovorax sp. J22R203]MDM0101622.1 energy transducer TonB [Variovorax sp. J22G73]
MQPEVGVVASASAAAAYLPASELDPPPRPLTEIRLAYPPSAGMRTGEVVLELLIGSSGAVENVKVIEATPPGMFEASAIGAFVSTRFSPGMRAGVPTAARMRVAVQFSATGMAVSGAETPLQAPPSR